MLPSTVLSGNTEEKKKMAEHSLEKWLGKDRPAEVSARNNAFQIGKHAQFAALDLDCSG